MSENRINVFLTQNFTHEIKKGFGVGKLFTIQKWALIYKLWGRRILISLSL
jgi:hypothetical protein